MSNIDFVAAVRCPSLFSTSHAGRH